MSDIKTNNVWLMKGDCLERMKEVESGSVDLTVTSPPYDNLRTYNNSERVICIPDSGGHTLDLQRVQYISPLEKGSYKVTLVSGWDLPLTDKVYSRQTLIEKWKALQNKSL